MAYIFQRDKNDIGYFEMYEVEKETDTVLHCEKCNKDTQVEYYSFHDMDNEDDLGYVEFIILKRCNECKEVHKRIVKGKSKIH